MATNRNINGVLQMINKIAKLSADGEYLFRGEPKHYSDVCSSLYNQFRQHLSYNPKHNIGQIQSAMLREARTYTNENDDFEILTQIQHYGGKTNLIDFTTDFLIGLFFACDRHFDEDGRVILLKSGPVAKHELKRPRHPQNRVIAQKSVFVEPDAGFIVPDKILSVPKSLKESILFYLERSHGIRTVTVYNDLHGFVSVQRAHDEAQTAFYQGLLANNIGEYDIALGHYNRSLEFHPNKHETYNNRGVIYDREGDLKSASKDFTKAIEIMSLPMYYFNRGLVFMKLGKWDKARSDFNNARNNRYDTVAAFSREDQNIADIERQYQVVVPEDIRLMLEPQRPD